jgi:zinc transporter
VATADALELGARRLVRLGDARRPSDFGVDGWRGRRRMTIQVGVAGSAGDHGAAGPVLAVLLDGQGGARIVALTGALPAAPESPSWIVVDGSDAAGRRWLAFDAGIDAGDLEVLLAPTQRTWVSGGEKRDTTLAALCSLSDDGVPTVLRMVTSPGRLVTVSDGPARPVLVAAIARLRAGKGARDLSDLVGWMVRAATDRLAEAAFALDAATSDLEYHAGAGGKPTPPEALHALQPRAALLRRRLAHHREGLERLDASSRSEATGSVVTGRWRSVRRQTEDLVEMVDRVTERLRAIDGYLQNQMSAILNDRLYVLTLISGLVLPATLITGLLGVNVGGVPLRSTAWGFPLLCLFLLALGVCQYFMMKRLQWLPRQSGHPASPAAPPQGAAVKGKSAGSERASGDQPGERGSSAEWADRQRDSDRSAETNISGQPSGPGT